MPSLHVRMTVLRTHIMACIHQAKQDSDYDLVRRLVKSWEMLYPEEYAVKLLGADIKALDKER